MAYEVLGIGSPFVDHILEISEDYLKRIQGHKGGMAPIDYATLKKIIQESGSTPVIMYGGSCANTIKGLANFGESCALFGKVGKDPAGKKFLEKLSDIKVTSLLLLSDTPTAQALCLITPDKERTMRSFLGASNELTPSDLHAGLFEKVKLVHIEGYQFLNPGVIPKALELAKAAGAKVSLDLGSFEIVAKYKSEILQYLTDHIDLLFGNQTEIHTLTRLNPERGCQILSDLGHTVVVMIGQEGCLVGQGNHQLHTPALKTAPIDTTGAGDLFISGFLHGYLQNRPLQECAQIGAMAGAAVVEVLGVDMPPQIWADLKERAIKK